VYQVHEVNIDSYPVPAEKTLRCKNRNCISYDVRSEWVIKYDVDDSAGNSAEQVLFSTILSDHQAPEIHVPTKALIGEAGKDIKTINLPDATATDNIDGPVPVTVSRTTVPGNVLGSYKVDWKSCDRAGFFGNGGENNCAFRAFKFTVSDTTPPTIKVSSSVVQEECLRGGRMSLASAFELACTDTFDPEIACSAQTKIGLQANTVSLSVPSTHRFVYTAEDTSGNIASTKALRADVRDSTPPSLRLSNVGLHFLTRDDNTGKYHFGTKSDFTHAALEDAGYKWDKWDQTKHITVRPGDAFEAELVERLTKHHVGYKCSDSCMLADKNAAQSTFHQRRGHPGTALSCEQTSAANKAEYRPGKLGFYTLRHRCTDAAGLTTTSCRTIHNVAIGKPFIRLVIKAAKAVERDAILGAVVSFFAAPARAKLGVKRSHILTGGPFPTSRRLLAAAADKADASKYNRWVFKIFVTPKAFAQAFKSLAVGGAFHNHLNSALEAVCADLKDKSSDHSYVCVAIDDITVPTIPQGTPLLKLGGKLLQFVEAMSTWTEPGAYCIKPGCGAKGGIEECPGRLPVQTTISWVDNKGIEHPYTGAMKPIDTHRLVEYIVEYNCARTVGGKTITALPKFRVLKVRDTTKPVCFIPGELLKVTREASFPYTAEPAACSDKFDGKVAVHTQGAYTTEKTGTYVMTYTATDKSGNMAAPLLQTIIVQDTLKPIIQLTYGTKVLHTSDHSDKGTNTQDNLPGYTVDDLHSV
jgi:hypothetical protein